MQKTTDRRVSLVTSATGGIGRGIAQALADRGDHVVICARSEEKGQRVAKEIDSGGGTSFVAVDMLDQGQVEALVDGIIAEHGRLDVLVNNAGGSSGFAMVEDMSDEAWMQAFHWNVSTAFWTIRRAMPTMKARGFGRIINVSSVQGKQVNQPTAAHYVMAKHALNGLTKAVAVECATFGVTCNALCVGAVETELMQTAGRRSAEANGLTYEAFKDSYAVQAMTKRLNTVEEVGATAVFLSSDAASGTTGSIVNVDGGTCSF